MARTIFIPAGTILTGAEHKAEHLNIACGDITVSTEASTQRITGYAVLPSLPGASLNAITLLLPDLRRPTRIPWRVCCKSGFTYTPQKVPASLLMRYWESCSATIVSTFADRRVC